MKSTPTSQHVHTGLRQSLKCGPDIALRWHDCALIQQQPVWEHFTGESQEVEDLGGASKCCQQKPTQQLATVGQRVTVSKNAAQMSEDCLRELEAKTQRLIRTQHLAETEETVVNARSPIFIKEVFSDCIELQLQASLTSWYACISLGVYSTPS